MRDNLLGKLIDFSDIFNVRVGIGSAAWGPCGSPARPQSGYVTAMGTTVRWSKFISSVLRGGMGARGSGFLEFHQGLSFRPLSQISNPYPSTTPNCSPSATHSSRPYKWPNKSDRSKGPSFKGPTRRSTRPVGSGRGSADRPAEKCDGGHGRRYGSRRSGPRSVWIRFPCHRPTNPHPNSPQLTILLSIRHS